MIIYTYHIPLLRTRQYEYTQEREEKRFFKFYAPLYFCLFRSILYVFSKMSVHNFLGGVVDLKRGK